MKDSFGSRSTLKVGSNTYGIARLGALEKRGLNISRLPFAIRVLLENLLRCEDGQTVTAADIEAVAKWDAKAAPSTEIAFKPARVLLQDFTGVPAIVDLAAMRDAMKRMGGDPAKINPLLPAELVIDHSVQVDEFGTAAALLINAEKEYERNRERYIFLRWGQKAFDNFKVVPPETGICHQVNLECLARVVMSAPGNGGAPMAYPDTLVGTDSHTTMINGLGVLGWGVGGIEAEAAMLGESISMLLPQVIGFRLNGKLSEGATATDLVLRVTEVLRKKGVVGKFVEFFGDGLAELMLADRATIANMAPEYGATCGIFPVDEKTLDYLRLTGRSDEQIALVETYMKAQGMFHTRNSPAAEYTDTLELDLATVEPSLAGPKRPQDRVALSNVAASFENALTTSLEAGAKKLNVIAPSSSGAAETATAVQAADVGTANARVAASTNGSKFELRHGSVVIAAITSCTNTSNPSVMVAAGIVAKKAAERGLKPKPWVKTSLAPGSKVVTDYLKDSGLLPYLEQLKFNVVGYGCTTCIGNSGPLPPAISTAIHAGDLVAVSVLSGNRNFEGRVSPDCRANYLASPPLVVAYALAGRIDIDLTREPLAEDKNGKPVFLKDIWPTQQEVHDTIQKSVRADMYRKIYSDVFTGSDQWRTLDVPEGVTYAWDDASTYVKNPPYFVDLPPTPPPVKDISGARVLALLGDSITTDHISPAGSIKADSPAGHYLQEHGVAPKDFNSYGSRRGNHEVMMRGTFANIRLRNLLVPGVEGGETVHLPDATPMSIYDAAMKYQADGVATIVIAGAEYGTGSSRDWAAKGPRLLGITAAVAQSYERIHRSNLVGMGILPLEFKSGDTVEKLGLTGRETFDIAGIEDALKQPAATREVTVSAHRDGAAPIRFKARVRIDTPMEVEYYRHGGILCYVLRKLLKASK